MRLVDYARIPSTAMVSPEAHYYGKGKVVIGEKSRIDHGVILTGDVSIGAYVHVAPYCLIYGSEGVELGDFVGLGAFSVLHTVSNDYSGEWMCSPLVPAEFRKDRKGKISMGRFANCGTRTTVMPGVCFGDGAVAGAHSLIVSDCEAWMIYAGTPARLLKERKKDICGLAAKINECV